MSQFIKYHGHLYQAADSTEKDKIILETHQSGADTVWVDWLYVPRKQRKQGKGAAAYLEFEKNLPKTIKYVRLFAADSEGEGRSDRFWESLGFAYRYDAEDEDVLEYEERYDMIKGVNGTPTPEPIYRYND